jgi:arylsulfatase A-like enzyme
MSSNGFFFCSNFPTNKKLYERAKKYVKSKVAVWPSAYESGQLVRRYKSLGGKYSSFEAGTRVPFIASWPAKIKKGTSDALLSQIDLIASMGALVGQSVDATQAKDSENQLATWTGQTKLGRSHVIEQAGSLAIRQGDWKYISPSKGPAFNAFVQIELGNNSLDQLYQLSRDPAEKVNVAKENPEKLQELKTLLRSIMEK